MKGLLLLLAAAISEALAAGQVCYDRLGCFPDARPYAYTFERSISHIPWEPETINTRFLLFTRENPVQFHEIRALNVSTVSASKFSPSRKSNFIIHGFLAGGEDEWLVDMCRVLLEVSDVNCFSVDWHGGSAALYTQAANNVRVVGAELAYFIDYLLDHFRYPLSNIHLIGHSLGAHVAGEAGKRRPGIARISGLDPAGPYFENTPPEVRLDPSDAALVDVIHTDGPATSISGFGMSQLAGHLDFFPNGGTSMPGCPNFFRKLGELDSVIEGVGEKIFCSHRRSVTLFLHSILHPEGFVSYPGTSYSAFQEGAGFPCSNGSCTAMGYYADSYTQGSESQAFFLNTGDLYNFQRWRYQVTANLTGTMFLVGSFSVSLCGKEDCSLQYLIYRGFIHFGKSYSSFIDVEMDIDPVRRVVFIWHREITDVLQPTLGATAMAVQYGPSGTIDDMHVVAQKRLHDTLALSYTAAAM
ncbi:pancreatic lipase-related protein 2-like [Dendropsophus ebraccatus]|uniref:pancreatic lipase-related protein 2-like n=1 Tax=Dendropsophus ebraccatus TaxID=150705 RepID=UPI0038315EDC